MARLIRILDSFVNLEHVAVITFDSEDQEITIRFKDGEEIEIRADRMAQANVRALLEAREETDDPNA